MYFLQIYKKRIIDKHSVLPLNETLLLHKPRDSQTPSFAPLANTGSLILWKEKHKTSEHNTKSQLFFATEDSEFEKQQG